MNKLTLYLGLAIIAITSGYSILEIYKPNNEYILREGFTTETINVKEERIFWSEMVDKIGPEKAYEDFKKEYLTKDMDTQHVAAHMFGDILYVKNINALQICDKYLAYGCYHGFIVRTIVDNGTSIVPELDKLCRKVDGIFDGQCQHGIGHGLVEYFGGYSKKTVKKAVAACDSMTNYKGLFSECIIGAFMAYREILPTTDEEIVMVRYRKLEEGAEYEPCISSPPRIRGMCYSGTALWLDRVFDKDYKKIGEYCDGVPTPIDRQICFFGIGLFAATSSEYEVNETMEKCSLMPEDSILMCITGAHISAKGYTEREHDPTLMCESLDKEDKDYCLNFQPYLLYEEGAKAEK